MRVALYLLACGAASLVSCGGGGGSGSSDGGPPAGGVTYHQDVAPILGRHCVRCHTTGGIAPFTMESFEDVEPHANRIKSQVSDGIMPPFLVNNSGDCETFVHDNELTAEDVAILAAWADGNAPEGDPGNPAVVEIPELPALAGVDAESDIGILYTPEPPALQADDYRCFVADAITNEEQYIVGYDVQPGDARVVHHVVVYLPTTESAQLEAEALDAGDESPGYSCFGGAGVSSDVIAVWAPGQGAATFPSGTGIPVPANRKPIVQVHYNIENGVFPDRTAIEFDLEADVAEPATIFFLGVAGGDDTIPPNQEAYLYQYSLSAPLAGTIHGVFPHMHNHGASQTMTIDGSCKMHVPRWDFHWQFFYFYQQPFTVEVGDSIAIDCTYDTRGTASPVSFGEDTSDEMCIVGVYMTL